MSYGAILVDLIVPDKNGHSADVVLGYDKLSDYFVNGCFFGSVIGPNANRIANAKFTLDGVEYHLDPNDGVNNLHSHKELGSHKRVWDEMCIRDRFSADYGAIMAGTVCSVIPIIIVYCIGQKYIVEGVAFAGVKG